MPNPLGKGLSSLIPSKKTASLPPSADEQFLPPGQKSSFEKEGVFEIDINKIRPNSRQPRKNFDEMEIKELADSIKQYGVIQPLVVMRDGDSYELIVGERRLRACRFLGMGKVPVIIRDYDEQKKLEVALIENIQREDLNPIEKASAYKELMDEFSISAEGVGARLGKSRTQVANSLRLLALPEEIKDALIKESISEAHGIYLVGLDSPAKQMDIFRKIVHNKWSVAETSRQLKKIGGTKESRIKDNYSDNLKELELQKFFGAKTEIKRANRGGKIIIDFYSDDQLEDMVRKIKS